MTDDRLTSIVEKAVGSAVDKALEKVGCANCACNLDPQEAREMRHLIGVFKDVGDGDMAKGIETTRDGLKFYRRFRAWAEKTGGKILTTIVLLILVTIIGWAGYGALKKIGEYLAKAAG